MVFTRSSATSRRKPDGFTLIEALVVCILMVILAAVLYPLVKNGYDAWVQADRMTELTSFSRVGMDRVMRDVRQSYSTVGATNSNYFIYEIERASSALFIPNATDTVALHTGLDELQIGRVTGPNSLARPIDQFAYIATTRNQTATGTASRIRAFELRTRAQDTVKNIDGVNLWSKVVPRVDREGHVISSLSTFSIDETAFNASSAAKKRIYVMAWSDQVSLANINQAYFQLEFGATTITVNMTAVGDGRYYGERCLVDTSGSVQVNVYLSDNGGEHYQGTDAIKVTACPGATVPNLATCTCD